MQSTTNRDPRSLKAFPRCLKAFPGATVSDMRSYIKPTIKKSPDQILLNIGTNDLKSREPNVIADCIVDLHVMLKLFYLK